jgi:cysteine synthase
MHCVAAATWHKRKAFFVGISAGATFACAPQIGAGAPKGSSILCMLPDNGGRYLSTPLFADVRWT